MVLVWAVDEDIRKYEFSKEIALVWTGVSVKTGTTIYGDIR